jgi:hypothetical protein
VLINSVTIPPPKRFTIGPKSLGDDLFD